MGLFKEIIMRHLLFALAFAFLPSAAWSADAPKRVLLVTHAGGFMHDSLLVAEKVLTALGPKNGFELKCYRFTADPDARITVKRKENGKDVEMEAVALDDYSSRFQRLMGEPVT